MADKKHSTIQGAASGAAIGTAFAPGVGTAIGAGIGGLAGWLSGGGKSRMETADEQYGTGGTVGDFQVPGYAGLNQGYGSAIGQRDQLAQGMGLGNRPIYVSDQRNSQLGLGTILAQEARGQGVGQDLVRMQARDAANRASAQQFAALGGARPGMQAMAARNAMLGTALAQSAVGNQAALGSAQMTLGAQQQYGQHLQGVRGQDESNRVAQYGLNDARVLGSQRNQLDAYAQQMQLMDQQRALAGMQQQGNQQYQQNQTTRWSGAMGQPTDSEVTMGAITGLGGAMMNYQKGAQGTSAAPLANSGPVDTSKIRYNGNSTAGWFPGMRVG